MHIDNNAHSDFFFILLSYNLCEHSTLRRFL
jgi:hypothetical protein